MMQTQAMEHLRNLHNKVIGALYCEFISSVEQSVSKPQHGALVQRCTTFSAFSKLLETIQPLTDVYNDILAASQGFCDTYGLAKEFWVQSDAVETFSVDADANQDYTVASSAAFLDAVCHDHPHFPELDPAWAMVEALVNFGKKHAERLDAMADRLRRAEQRYLAAFQQEQQQQQEQAQ